MSETTIGNKDRISILALEYSSLRSHINTRVASIFQLTAVVVAITALLLHHFSNIRNTHIAFSLLAIFGIIGICLLWYDMRKAGKRVQQLEAEINRCANENLLIWETELGGISGRYFPWSIWAQKWKHICKCVFVIGEKK